MSVFGSDWLMDDVLGDPFGTYERQHATQQASETQAQSAEAGIEEQRRQFDLMREEMAPYSEAGLPAIGGLQRFGQAGADALPGLSQYATTGTDALNQQRAIMGLDGPEAQQAAIDMVQSSPEYQAIMKEGEAGLLAGGSATGQLRGGNMKRALAEFRPGVLSNMLRERYQRLGGLAQQGGNIGQFLSSSGQGAYSNIAGLGQASAAGTGAAAQQTGANVANLLQQQGAARAGGQLAVGPSTAESIGQVIDLGSSLISLGAF